MICAFRHLVACLLLLAIPLQGYAASTMLFCTAGQHSQTESAQAPATIAHHGDHTGHPVPLKKSSQHHGDAKTPKGTTTCSACSLCCNLVVMMPSHEVVATFASHERLLPAQILPPQSPSLKGLKRPPRARLA
jgi:hypothetical protein